MGVAECSFGAGYASVDEGFGENSGASVVTVYDCTVEWSKVSPLRDYCSGVVSGSEGKADASELGPRSGGTDGSCERRGESVSSLD